MRNMLRIFGGDFCGKIRKLMDYTGRGGDIADPWYSRRFDVAYRDIYEGARRFWKTYCIGVRIGVEEANNHA